MPIRIAYKEPVEYYSNLEAGLDSSSPLNLNRNTTPSLGYKDRYPEVDMPASVLEAQKANQNISSPTEDFSPASYLGDVTGYTQHNIDNQLLKDAVDAGRITENQYKLMGGYNVAQNMPQNLGLGYGDVGLASLGYQGAKKVAGGLDWLHDITGGKIGVEDTLGMSKYGDIGALESIYLNTMGAKGLNPYDLQTYGNILGHHKPIGGMYPGGRHELVSPRTRFKQQQIMNRRKQDMQQTIRQHEAKAAAKAKAEKKRIEQEKIKTAQKNWKPTYNPASSHAEAQATGGDYHSGNLSTVDGQTTDWGPSSHMIARGGLAQRAPRYANGGLIDFFRYGGFIG